MEQPSISSKAQEAIRLQLEVNKRERRLKNKVQKLAEAERKRVLTQAKAKKKHQGR